MQLDVQTLYFINVAVLFIAAITAVFFWRRNPQEIALQEWAIATGVGGLGTLLLGMFGPVPASRVMGVIGNTLIFAGFAIAWETMRRFNGRPAANSRVAVLIFAFLVIFGAASYLGADVRARAVLVSLAVAPLALLTSREIALGGKKEPLSSRTPTAIIFGAVAVDVLLRAIDAGFSPSVIPELAFFEDPIQSHLVFAMTIGLVCLSVGGLSMMEQERLLNRQEKAALTDELTQLPNRRSFDERAGRLVKRASISGAPACILVMDLDRFARINERFGHAGGDRALAAFAALLREHIRPTDLVARYGGEEFCALLVNTDVTEGERIAQRLRAAVADLVVDMNGQPMSFTVSVGLAALQGDDLGGSIERADQALYQAKRQGRDRVAVAASGSSAA
jgi:diguanylate cyclase (GGDEF)-like protein